MKTNGGEWISPWGQSYFWSIDESAFRITTTANSGGDRDQSFPAGLAWHMVKTLVASKLMAEAKDKAEKWFSST